MVRRALLSILFAFPLMSCEPPSGDGASERIAQQVEAHIGEIIDLRDVLPGPWTRLFIFGPYTTRTDAQRALGRPWPYRWGPIDVLDDRVFIVVMDSTRIVSAFDQPYTKGHFVDPRWLVGYPRDSVRFRVSDRGTLSGGAPYRVVEWVP